MFITIIYALNSQDTKTIELLATVRCQAGTRRLWLRMRILSLEEMDGGQMESTRVLVYILPAGAPRVARLIKLHLPTLPHYSKYETLEVEDKNT